MSDLPRFALAKVALHFSYRAQRPLLKEGNFFCLTEVSCRSKNATLPQSNGGQPRFEELFASLKF